MATDPTADRRYRPRDQNVVAGDIDRAALTLLDVLEVLTIRRRVAAEAIAAAIASASSLDQLGRLPQVELGDDRITIDDRWPPTAHPVDDDVLERATLAAVAQTMRSGDLAEAGRIATAGRSGPALRSVLRSALRVVPPVVSAHDLRSWRDAEVLEAQDPHEWWLDATCRSLLSGPSPELFDRYEQARMMFAELGDADAEIAVGMAAAIIARRLNDTDALVAFILRAGELAEQGCRAAVACATLGRALVLQMGGDPSAALAELDRVPNDSLDGDWGAQLSMMRGTNLILLGRLDEALAHLTAATGTGGKWSYSVALELSASARWSLDDRVGAIRDLEVAEEVALGVGATVDADRIRSQRVAMLAADGDPSAASLVLESLSGLHHDEESARILGAAQAISVAGAGDLELARTVAAALDAPDRAVRSTHWVIPIQTALVAGSRERWAPVLASHDSLQPAMDAGVAGRIHVEGGPLAPRTARPYLPVTWCEPAEPVLEIRLLGGATVLRDRRVVREQAWERGRVRELCCYLALVDDSSRTLASERVWPDLSSAAAAKNLRVTLTYLLDVLDPDRERGEGSDLITDQDGTISLARTDRLRIDLRELLTRGRAVLRAAQAGDDHAVLREARLLVRLPTGPILGGATVGSWLDSHEQSRRELVLRAVSAAGPVVLRAGNAELAEMLARRGLEEDPWAERLHQTVARACLARDDIDAARRVLRRALEMIGELEVRPERATLDLARQVGIDISS